MILENAINEHMPDIRVARRKGRKVRLQNVRTLRMGRWITDPYAEEQREADAKRAAYEAEQERMRRLPVIHTRTTLEAYTVAQIRTAAQTVLGETFKAKVRKADMIDAYLTTQAGRLA